MSDTSILQDEVPWLTSSGVVVDQIAKTATVTGAATLFTKKFDMRRLASFSFHVQSSNTSSGVAPVGTSPPVAWRIFAANDYDPTRPTQKPGTFMDVTADLGATANTSAPPGVHQFFTTFSGANVSDRCSSWACPWGAIQFQLVQASGTGIYLAQFFAGEV